MATNIVGQPNKGYVSAIQLLDKREINPNSLSIYNEDGLTDILGIAGRYKPTKMSIYHLYINDALFKQVQLQGAATGTGTKADPLVCTLTAATSNVLRKTDIVKLPSGKNGYVVNVVRGANDVVTIKPIGGAALTIASGGTLNAHSVAVGEKSTALENRRYGLSKSFNVIQYFREVNEETDTQQMSAIEVNFEGQSRWSAKSIADKFLIHKANVNAALIGGQLGIATDGGTDANVAEFGSTAAIVDPVGGGNTQFTRGLDEAISTDGFTDAVDALGVIDMDDFGQLQDQLVARKTPKDFMVYAGSAVRRAVDDTLSGVNNLLTKGQLMLDGQKRNFEVTELKYGAFKYQFANLPMLDSVEHFSGTLAAKSLYFIPTDNVKVRGGGSEPRLQIRYMKGGMASSTNTGNEIWEEWHTGAMAPTGATNDERVWRTNWFTAQGLEVNGAKDFTRLQVLA